MLVDKLYAVQRISADLEEAKAAALVYPSRVDNFPDPLPNHNILLIILY